MLVSDEIAARKRKSVVVTKPESARDYNNDRGKITVSKSISVEGCVAHKVVSLPTE